MDSQRVQLMKTSSFFSPPLPPSVVLTGNDRVFKIKGFLQVL